jgi:hypothetical protein
MIFQSCAISVLVGVGDGARALANPKRAGVASGHETGEGARRSTDPVIGSRGTEQTTAATARCFPSPARVFGGR